VFVQLLVICHGLEDKLSTSSEEEVGRIAELVATNLFLFLMLINHCL